MIKLIGIGPVCFTKAIDRLVHSRYESWMQSCTVHDSPSRCRLDPGFPLWLSYHMCFLVAHGAASHGRIQYRVNHTMVRQLP